MFDINDLNKEQIDAVENTEGFVRLLAGAGTGKTRTLTYRYAYLVNVLGISPSKILCITFTNKAALEMKERINGLCGSSLAPFITTFHGYCASFLKDNIQTVGYPKNFSILDTIDQKQILTSIYKKNNIKKKELPISKVVDFITKEKSTLDYVNLLYTQDTEALMQEALNEHDLYKKLFLLYIYEQRRSFSLDFDDLITVTLDILLNSKTLCETTAKNLEYILVDEFQDIDDNQYRLVERLCSYHKNLFIVGDPDQTIYSFRGANVDYFMDFDKDYPDVKTFYLVKNYRSQNHILDLAFDSISNNHSDLRRKLVAMRQDLSEKDMIKANTPNTNKKSSLYNKDLSLESFANIYNKGIYTKESSSEIVDDSVLSMKPFIINCTSQQEQTDYIIDLIENILAKTENRTIAILARSRFSFPILETALIDRKIPYALLSDLSFFERKVTKDIVSYLKLILNKDDDIAFERIINVPTRGIGDKTIDFIIKTAHDLKISYFKAFKYLIHKDNSKQSIITRLKKNLDAINFINIIEENAHIINTKPYDALETILNSSGYEQYLRDNDDGFALSSLNTFKNLCKNFQNNEDESNIADFLINISMRYAYKKDEKNAVILSTIHNVKGLEYDYVFIPDLNESIFPSVKSIDNSSIEEERRLFYVGITRARIQLFLLQCEGLTFLKGYPEKKVRSRFLKEIKDDLCISLGEISNIYYEDQYCSLEENNSNFIEGDIVESQFFGKGEILEVDLFHQNYVVFFEKQNKERTLSFKSPLKKIY